jgi:CheY-like chemotaxis protein
VIAILVLNLYYERLKTTPKIAPRWFLCALAAIGMGVEALRLEKNDISLVLLDMTMPVMSGEEAFRQIRMISSSVRVILSSGYNEVEAIRRFTNKGLAGFIQKPYTSVELARKVKTVLTSDQTE